MVGDASRALPLLHIVASLSSINVPQPACLYALLLLSELTHVSVPSRNIYFLTQHGRFPVFIHHREPATSLVRSCVQTEPGGYILIIPRTTQASFATGDGTDRRCMAAIDFEKQFAGEEGFVETTRKV